MKKKLETATEIMQEKERRTATEIFLEIINLNGYANNYFFVNNHITNRLGAVVNSLKDNRKYEFYSFAEKDLYGGEGKDFLYVLKKVGKNYKATETAISEAKRILTLAKKMKIRDYQTNKYLQ